MELFSRRIWTTGSAQHVWNIAILYVQDNLFQFIKHPTLVKLGPTLPSSPSTKELHGESKRVIICPIETNALDPAAAEAIPKSFPFKRHYFRLRAVTLSLSRHQARVVNDVDDISRNRKNQFYPPPFFFYFLIQKLHFGRRQKVDVEDAFAFFHRMPGRRCCNAG